MLNFKKSLFVVSSMAIAVQLAGLTTIDSPVNATEKSSSKVHSKAKKKSEGTIRGHIETVTKLDEEKKKKWQESFVKKVKDEKKVEPLYMDIFMQMILQALMSIQAHIIAT